MKQAFSNMLEMQDRMNQKVHPDWINQNYEWYRAIWVECGELLDHYGYKWWKKQQPDMNQVNLEVIDIWHFGMSALFAPDKTRDELAQQIENEVDSYHHPVTRDVREATENLAEDCLRRKGFSVAKFWDLLNAVDMNFDELYRQYVGKNVLNFFRQDNGYKTGTYIKVWHGREDNEHLVDILDELNAQSSSFPDDVYAGLAERYQSVIRN